VSTVDGDPFAHADQAMPGLSGHADRDQAAAIVHNGQ
jgi:hypothetical protein